MNVLQNLTPRDYQKKIVETAIHKNCLVVLPTGVGKTLIALMLTIERMKLFPGKKVVFLAPTKPLVEQHFEYFKKNLPELFASIEMFTGKIPASQRKKLWQYADIVFSTPQCIAHDVHKKQYNLQEVGLLIEDEAHRCLKNYAYTYVVNQCKRDSQELRIIGLTASPGSEKAKIEEICKNLSIEAIEIRTRESEDVKDYLQELTIENENVEFPAAWENIREPLKKLYQQYIDELKSRQLLFLPSTKMNIINLQKKLFLSAEKGNSSGNLYQGISLCATALKLQHALELLETQTLTTFHVYLKSIYDQANTGSKGVQRLVKKQDFITAYQKTLEEVALKHEHPKLKRIIEKVIKNHTQENRKTIIFAHYRETAAILVDKLNELPKINAQLFIGQAKKNGRGLSQKEQQAVLEKFKFGETNIICATSIGEEGLDIPEVHEVMFYEPIPSEIRKIQRAGRTARLLPGTLTTFITRGTRDEAYHYAALNKEKKMKTLLENMQDKMQNINKETQKRLI